jgi:oligopeptide transport system substrate-binding protein
VTYDGHVDVANGIVPQGLENVDWTANILGYDPQAAKALLANTSLANGNNAGVALYTNGDYGPVAMKLQLEQNLGIKADVVELDWPDFISDINARRLPVLTLDWIADYPDPEDFLRVLFYSTSNQNPIGYHNAAVDQLLDQAIAEPDAGKRSALYQQAQQAIIDDAVVIPLYSDIDYELVAPYVHGLQISPVGMLGLESVWITK